jgi:4-amino-4-deoxy-L-arabinose transferase-like glycosyltransferase
MIRLGTTRNEVWVGLLLFLAALAVRLGFLYDISDSPSFLHPLVDAKTHSGLAQILLESEETPTALFWRSVFYPLYLAAAYFLSGSSVLVAKLFQAFLGASTCLLTYRLGRRCFGDPVGLLAGAITAFYGPLLFWESELVAAGWAAFWTVSLLLLALRVQESHSLESHFAFGLVGGAAVLTRPSFLPFVLLTIIWLGWSARQEHREWALGHIAVSLLGFLLLTLPTAIASHRIAEHASFLPRAGALNLYIGNNPDRCATLRARPGSADWKEVRDWGVQEGYEERADEPRFFREQVINYATTQPWDFAGGILHKLVQFANGREIPRNVDIYVFREWSATLRVLVWKAGNFGFPWGLLFPLALVGLALAWRAVPAPLLILIGTYPLVIALTFVAGRYRVPIVPALSILAAAGVTELAVRLQQRYWRSAVFLIALIVAIAFITNHSDRFCEEDFDFPTEMYLALAVESDRAGRADEAVAQYREALRHDPDSQIAHSQLARIFVAREEFDRAIGHYDEALRVAEYHWLFHRRGIAYRSKGDFVRALDDFGSALELKPGFAPSHQQRGEVYFRTGETEKALQSIQLAFEHAVEKKNARQARATLEWMERQER